MYQVRESEMRHEHSYRRLEEAGIGRPSAPRDGAAHPGGCLRLVRVPGGFAYVADEPADQPGVGAIR